MSGVRNYEISTLPTQYGGVMFRSRLEARWAVYFDLEKIEWIYEPEGFDLPELGRYLPDFYLPEVRMYAEVKPDKFTKDELYKCMTLAEVTKRECLILEGLPDSVYYFAVDCGHPDGYGSVAFFDSVVVSGCNDRHVSENKFYTRSEFEALGRFRPDAYKRSSIYGARRYNSWENSKPADGKRRYGGYGRMF